MLHESMSLTCLAVCILEMKYSTGSPSNGVYVVRGLPCSETVYREPPSEMEENSQATDFEDAVKVIEWNKQLLRCTGVWPSAVYNPLYMFFVLYLIVHCSSSIVDLTVVHPKSIDYVVRILTENVPLLMTVAKITICRLNSRSIARLLIEINNDFSLENYKSDKEKLIFLDYNKLSRRFIMISVAAITVVTGLYFFKAVVTSVITVMMNTSLEYQLPYKTRLVTELHDIKIYAFFCVYQWFVVVAMISGYVGSDCLFASLALHITGQFAILRCKVEGALLDTGGCHQGIKKLVLKHHRLIRLAETLENDFNIMIFQQLLGTTLNLCVSGYHALVSSKDGQNIILLTFFVYTFSVMSTLFIYCYVGECLIEESTGFGDTLYQSDWYGISPINLKLISICMQRASKPLLLTSAKFCALSLDTFSDIVKTSLGYLSVLRAFL